MPKVKKMSIDVHLPKTDLIKKGPNLNKISVLLPISKLGFLGFVEAPVELDNSN